MHAAKMRSPLRVTLVAGLVLACRSSTLPKQGPGADAANAAAAPDAAGALDLRASDGTADVLEAPGDGRAGAGADISGLDGEPLPDDVGADAPSAAMDAAGDGPGAAADATSDGPTGAICAPPPAAPVFSLPLGFSPPLSTAPAAAHVTSVSAHAVALALDAGGTLDFSWPSQMPDLAAGDAAVLELACPPPDRPSGRCWEVVRGPRAVAATFADYAFLSSPPPPLLGFDVGLAPCAFWVPPSMPSWCPGAGLPGHWSTMFALDVRRGADRTMVPVTAVGTLAGWRFENLGAIEAQGINASCGVLDGIGWTLITATGPP
jgi:hypothetical protein